MYTKRSGGSIVFTNGKKILLLRRSKGSGGSGKWDLPGGRSNPGETLNRTAVRETKEECGRVEGKLFHEVTFEHKNVIWSIFFYKVSGTFVCKLSHEHDDWKWVKIDDIPRLKLHHKLKEHLNKYIIAIRENML